MKTVALFCLERLENRPNVLSNEDRLVPRDDHSFVIASKVKRSEAICIMDYRVAPIVPPSRLRPDRSNDF